MKFLKPFSIVRGERLSPIVTTITSKEFIKGINARGNPLAYGFTIGSTFIGIIKYRFVKRPKRSEAIRTKRCSKCYKTSCTFNKREA